MTTHRRRPSVAGLVGLLMLAGVTAAGFLYLERTVDLPLWVEVAWLIVLGVQFAQLGLSTVWWLYPPERSDNDAVEAAFATVAAIFALLFGFVIVVVWEAHDEAETAVSREANAIAELARMADGFGKPTERAVLGAADAYLERVLSDEWPKLANGESSAAADRAVADLWAIYTRMPSADRAGPLYSQSVARLVDLGDARRHRLDAAQGSAVPTLLWVMLYAGAVLTVFLAYLFQVHSTALQRILVTLMAGVMVLALFLIGALERPFDDRLPIEPTPLETVRNAAR